MNKHNKSSTEKGTLQDLFTAIRRTIGFDINGEDVDVMLQAARNLTKNESLLLLKDYENVDKRELGLGRNQQARVYLVRFLVALFPLSQPLIELWLSQFGRPEDYEIQFTLFCYLDEIPHFGSAEDIAEVSRLTLNYLMNVKADTGHASWMAGDMLANHWDTDQSLPVLLSAAKNARFVSGRDTALFGLESLTKGELSVQAKAAIRAVLEAIAKNDRSVKLKSEAERLLIIMGQSS